MARLPKPGGDNGNWGAILNDYLSQAHKSDGSIKDDAIGAGQIIDGAISTTSIQDGVVTEVKLAPAIQTKLNQTAPTWSTLSGKPAVIATGVDQTAARTAISAVGKGELVINVKDYAGIDLTGATTSDVVFQSILTTAANDAAATAGTVEVYIPPGVLSLTTRMTVGAGVTVRGAARGATTVKSSSTQGVLSLTGASDITITDLTIQSTDAGSTSIPILSSYSGLQKRISITNCRIVGATSPLSAVRFATAVEQLTFSDNIVENCAAGFALYAPVLASGFLSTQIVVSRNRFRNVGSVNIQLYGGANAATVSTIVGVEITGNDLRDFAQTGPAGPIPIEPTGVTNLRIANNTIDGPSTRGISTGNNVNVTITGNTIRNQSVYAFELNGGRQISIVGNIVENCVTFAMETGSGVRLSDIVIANNVYVGSGLASTQTVEVIRLVSARRARISGNTFVDWQYLRCAIRIGNGISPQPEDCVIEGNTFAITDANTPLLTVNIRSAIRTNVFRNTLRINRDLVAGDDYVAAISAQMDALSSDTVIDGNHIMFTGTVTAAPNASGVGNNLASAAACVRLTVRRNDIASGPLGLSLRTTSTDLVVQDNATSTCSVADVIPGTAVVMNFVDTSSAQTLTNKTLTAPKVAQINDTNGNASLGITATASAVNYLKVINNGTGVAPVLQAEGPSSDIDLRLAAKGNALIALRANSANAAQFTAPASAVNWLYMQSAIAAGTPSITAVGSDANISLALAGKGTASILANSSLTMADAKNLAFGTTTGTRIGTSTSQKLGFWNASPIVQPTTAVSAATFTANSGTAINDASTFDGYTMAQIVKALRNAGLLA